MKLIISHEGMDFDSLAGCIAAFKLYGGTVVSIGKKRKNVAAFLKLYYKYFNVENFSPTADYSDAKELVIIDTRRAERLGKVAEILQTNKPHIIVYDHHPSGDIDANENYVESVGAVTTLLVEKLLKQNIEINPIEANLFLMGIYEDTGALLYPNTTYRDIQCVAELVRLGGKLDIVASYLNREFDDLQKKLSEDLRRNLTVQNFNDIPVAITFAEEEEIVGGIADVVHKIMNLENYKAVFAVIGMGKRTHIVGRTTINMINVNEVMIRFGGGGHIKAGSATVLNRSVGSVKEELLSVLGDTVHSSVVAVDIMSCPLVSLKENEKIEDVAVKIMYTEFMNYPIVNDSGIVTGIVTREKMYQKIDKGEMNIPMKALMDRTIVTVHEMMPFERIQETFMTQGLSIVLVADAGGFPLGVITSSDIINVLHVR